jgi:hypothetical protein
MAKRGPSKTTPKAFGGYLDYPIDVAGTNVWTTIQVGSPEWFTWLRDAKAFFYQANDGGFTARRETRRRGGDYWIAYKQHGDRVFKQYIGTPDDVTQKRLHQVWTEIKRAVAHSSEDKT